jgi:hypothetical protein
VSTAKQTSSDAARKQNSLLRILSHWVNSNAALVVSIVAALFAFWQGWIARNNELVQLRGYVGWQFKDGSKFVAGQPFKLKFGLVDHGQTPVRITELDGKLIVEPFPLPAGFEPPYQSIGDVAISATIYPDVGEDLYFAWVSTDGEITDSDWSQITSNDGHLRLYFFGQVYYKDVFGKSRKTSFCQYVNPSGIGWSSDHRVNSLSWKFYYDYNQFD